MQTTWPDSSQLVYKCGSQFRDSLQKVQSKSDVVLHPPEKHNTKLTNICQDGDKLRSGCWCRAVLRVGEFTDTENSSAPATTLFAMLWLLPAAANTSCCNWHASQPSTRTRRFSSRQKRLLGSLWLLVLKVRKDNLTNTAAPFADVLYDGLAVRHQLCVLSPRISLSIGNLLAMAENGQVRKH